MRLAVDTNVLLRAILRDSITQGAQAEMILRRADQIVISIVVLCELAWVLRSSRKLTAAQVHATLTALTDSAKVEVDRSLVRAGLQMLRSGGDFADGCIAEQARAARCDHVATFDGHFARTAGPFASHPANSARRK